MSGHKIVLICLLCIQMGCADNSTSHLYIDKGKDTVLQIMMEPAFDAQSMICIDFRKDLYYLRVGPDPSPFGIGDISFPDTLRPEYLRTLQPLLSDSMIAALRPYNDSGQYFDGLGIQIIVCSGKLKDTILTQNFYPEQLKEILKEHMYAVSKHIAQRKFRLYCMMRFSDWRQFYPIDFL